MDENVYFSISYLSIPLAKADAIRKVILEHFSEHDVSFTYSKDRLIGESDDE